jgi:mitochondrial fission protein ELM1
MQSNLTPSTPSDAVVMLKRRRDDLVKLFNETDEIEHPGLDEETYDALIAAEHDMTETPAASLAGVLEKLRIVAKAVHEDAEPCLDDLLLRSAIEDLERLAVGVNSITS